MYGTLLDQKVFEAFVDEKLPVLWEYIVKHDIQLSIISLPWFLSLFFTSMPLEYAVRIMDIFFMNGPKSLFQVALAVLKINSDDILQADDDGMFIAIIKNYFQTLDQSAHPDSPDMKYRQITKFQELLVTAFKEFNVITEQMIYQERSRHEKTIFQNIETFVKRTQLRHMPRTFHLTDDNLSNIYDIYYNSIESHKISMGTGSSNMNFDIFVQFLSKICDWCKPCERDSDPAFRKQKSGFLRRLFDDWDTASIGELTLNDVVSGLDKLVTPDLLESINYFFSLYDSDNDGELHREEVLQLSEGLLLLTEPWKSGRYVDLLTKKSIEDDIAENIAKEKIIEETNNGDSADISMEQIELPTGVTVDEEKYRAEQAERYLKAASNFLQRSFEYAQSLDIAEEVDLIDLSDSDDGETNQEDKLQKKKKKYESIKANAALDPTHPKVIDLATFRMIILADETYELFFAKTFRLSIHVDESVQSDNNKNNALRGMFDGILADGRRVAEQVRRRVDSVATRNSMSSVDSQTGGSLQATVNTDKYDDMDDFTSDQQLEHEELLNNPWVDVDDAVDGKEPVRQERAIQALPPQLADHDLIEFEA